MFISRYGRFRAMFMFEADGGANGGAGTSGSEGITDKGGADKGGNEDKDYKALYEQEVAERIKLKKSFDKTASEVAELKKQHKEKMTEQERQAADLEEREQRYREMENQLYSIKVDNLFAKAGFAETDYAELSQAIVEGNGENASGLAEKIIEFVKKANASAIASAKNGMIKASSVAPNASAKDKNKEEHPYADIAIKYNSPTKKSEEIKNYYRKTK